MLRRSSSLALAAQLWLLTAAAAAAAGSSTLHPPVLPLVVRNPYLSTWLQNARDEPWTSWPIFWTGQHVGLSLMASVPATKTVYPLLGRPQDLISVDAYSTGPQLAYPKYLGATYDASTTNLTYHIPAADAKSGPAKLTVSFLSPITPTSSMRQSIPASYITVYAEGSFDINVYMDISADWLSGDGNSAVQWFFQETGYEDSGSLWSWQIEKQQQAIFTEFNDRAEWGTLRFTAAKDMRYQSGPARTVRQTFAEGGLKNQAEQNFGPIAEQDAVFAFEKAFKLSNASSSVTRSALFTISHIQDQVVQFASARGLTLMRPLWKSFFISDKSLVTFHYNDYRHAKALADNFTAQLDIDARKAGGYEYRDIVSLAARQVMGALSFSGTPDNPLVFLKEISSNGNAQTIDVIFPAWPFFIYANPRWLAYILEPQLEHQLSGQYPNKYSMHDLGAHFPNLTGHADGRDEYMPIEECGDMLIMSLSIVQSLLYGAPKQAQSMWSTLGVDRAPPQSGTPFPLRVQNQTDETIWGLDDQWGGIVHGELKAQKWVERSYSIFKQWTEYLIDESLEPSNQRKFFKNPLVCTDDFAGWLPLQSNLALKGMVGIRAMSELASIIGDAPAADYYRKIGDKYITKWQEYALTRDKSHAKLAYDWYGSWTTLYSLYADAALCFHAPSKSGQDKTMHGSEQKPLSANPVHANHSAPFIPSYVYEGQSHLYSLVMQRYGLPLDSRHLYSKSDWQMQAAAVASPSVKREIISRIALWLNETNTDLPFTDLFETEGRGEFGAGNRFTARPVQGSLFALLQLDRACGGEAWSDDSFSWLE